MDDIERKLWADVYANELNVCSARPSTKAHASAKQEADAAVKALRDAAARDSAVQDGGTWTCDGCGQKCTHDGIHADGARCRVDVDDVPRSRVCVMPGCVKAATPRSRYCGEHQRPSNV